MNTTQIQSTAPGNGGRPLTFPPKDSVSKIKVAFVVGSLRDGGAERQALELLHNLDHDDFAASLILMEGVNLDRALGWVEQHFVMGIPQGGNSRWLGRSFSFANAVRRTAAQLKVWDCDVVHAFSPGPSVLGGLAARMAKVPVFIGSRHSLVSLYRKGGGMSALADKLAFRLSDVTLAPSRAVTAEMMELGGCPPEKCHTLYNGIDTARFAPALSREWRARMGWEEHHIVFGMVANFRACKGHSDFVQAAAAIANRHPEARFVMVGADQGLRPAIEQQVKELGLQSTARVVDADPFPEKIFAAMDVCVCTSTSEAFSIVLAEAMACGRPVIATAVGGIPEVVRHGDTGFLVPAGDPAAVAKAAEALLRDPELRRAMGMRGRQRIEAEFSLGRMVNAHQELYRDLVEKYRRRIA